MRTYVFFFSFSGAPLAPYGVGTTNCANYTTNLTWSVVLPPDILPPLGFIIEVAYRYSSSNLPISSFSKLADVSSGSARSYVVKNLQPHNFFYFRVRAKNQVGVGFPGYVQTSKQFSCVTNSRSKYRSIKYATVKARLQVRVNFCAVSMRDSILSSHLY